MPRSEIGKAFERLLTLRGMTFSPASRLIADLGLDSQDLVAIVLEFEAILGRELDEDILTVFVNSTVGEICTRLAA